MTINSGSNMTGKNSSSLPSSVTATPTELNILSGKSFVDEDNMASNSATAIASQQSIKAYVDNNSNIIADSTTNTNFPVVFHNESNGLLDDTGALRYNPSSGTLLVPNITVSGITKTVDTVTMEAANAIIFEGATADGRETTLTIVDPTTDRTINLPNQSGTIPLLSAASNTAITSTPEELNLLDTSVAGSIVNSKAVIYGSSGEVNATTLKIAGAAITSTATELNILDGDTSVGTTSISDGHGLLMNHGGTIAQTTVQTLASYLDDEITAMPNLVTTGALNTGTITSGFGNINNGTSTITTTGLISGGSLDIDNILINSNTIGHTDDTDLLTLTNGVLTVAGEISVTTLDIGGTNVSSTAAELNLLDTSVAGSIVNSKAVIYGSAGEVHAKTLKINGANVTSTAAELNILDGSVVSTASSFTVASGDGVLTFDSSHNVINWVPYASVCFLKGTKITIHDNTQKNIEDLTLEDIVLTYKIDGLSQIRNKSHVANWSSDTINGIFSKSPIRNIWVTPTDYYLVINNKLKITKQHLIHYKRNNKYYFNYAELLKVNDELFTDKNIYEKIYEIIEIKDNINVYNIELDIDQTYFAENYLVHHFCRLCSGYANII